MLTRFIVSTYKGITELALWVCVVAGAVTGFQLGSFRGGNTAILGMFVGAVVTFLFLAIFLGAALLLAEIHSSLLRIETKGNKPQAEALDLRYRAEQIAQSRRDATSTPNRNGDNLESLYAEVVTNLKSHALFLLGILVVIIIFAVSYFKQ